MPKLLFKNSVTDDSWKAYIGKRYTRELAQKIPYGVITDTTGTIVALVEIKKCIVGNVKRGLMEKHGRGKWGKRSKSF